MECGPKHRFEMPTCNRETKSIDQNGETHTQSNSTTQQGTKVNWSFKYTEDNEKDKTELKKTRWDGANQ